MNGVRISRLPFRATLQTGRGGYTLLELAVGLIAVAALLAGTAATLVVATQAADTSIGPADDALDAQGAVVDLTGELRSAVQLTRRDADALQFTTTRRDEPVTIRYEWSGEKGGPLERTIDDGPTVAVLDDVHEFALRYGIEAVSVPGPPEELESKEQELMNHATENGGPDVVVSGSRWVGSYFQPSLPADALHWRVAAVELLLRREQTGQALSVQLCRPDGRRPGPVIEEASIQSDTLSADYSRVRVPFRNAVALDPAEGLFVVLLADGTDSPARVQCETGGDDEPRLFLVESADRGASWTARADGGMRFIASGTITTPGDPATITKNLLKTVEITLRVGDDARARVYTAVELLNAPEATP
ncbi:MAG: hypothetical protein ACREJB_09845 [Planctomycetaceae bacterium]